MAIDEVSNLKSEILFGSSHCSCTSCDTIRCFTKRNIIENECRCPLCNEPTTCMYNVKNLPVKVVTKANGSKENQMTNKQVKVGHSPNRKKRAKRNLQENQSVINIQLVKKNVYIQTQPHAFKDDPTKCKGKDIRSQHQSHGANDALVNILHKLLTNYNGASIQNVIGRIADKCTECSCQPCDCVLSSTSEGCDCKPCECTDCKSALTPNTRSFEIQKRNDDLVPIEGNSPCDCKPCDCDECKMYNININDEGQLHNFNILMPQRPKRGKILERCLSKSSLSKSFQCAKCKSMWRPSKNVIVAPVTEYPQQLNSCSCSPCDCHNCRLIRSSVSIRGMREMSTGMMQNLNCKCTQCLDQTCRQMTSSCRCESRNSVINKPFDNNDQNIDIHSALIAKKASQQSCAVSALTDVVLGFIEENVKKINYESHKDNLHCESKNEPSASKSASFCPMRKLSAFRMNDGRISRCQCSPCECKICDKFKRKGKEQSVWKSEVFRTKCDCEVCRCLYCGDLLQFSVVGDNNIDDWKANKPTDNRDRSVYLALLHDVYSSYTYAIKGNRYEVHNCLSDKATRLQNASEHLPKYLNENNMSSLYSAFSASMDKRETEKHDAFSQENQFHESFEKHCRNYQEVLKNNVVETFVSSVLRTDEISDLNLDVRRVILRPSKDEQISNIGESLEISRETLNTKSRYKNDSNGRSKEMSIARTKSKITHAEPKINKKKNIKLVPESFRKTNIDWKIYEKDIQNVSIERTSKVIKTSGFKLDANDIIIKPKDDEFLPTPENYIEKCIILFKAKLLTYELLKMLYQCQKAHSEFKSVTENLDIKCDSNPKKDTIHHKAVELCDEINVSNIDLKHSWTKVPYPTDKREVGFEKEHKSKGCMIINKKPVISDIVRNTEIKQSRNNSKLNIPVEVVSKNFVTVDELTNTHNRVKCASHLKTILKKTESVIMTKNSSVELHHLCYNTWNINKKGETAKHNKIKYIDINDEDKKDLCYKKQYILIENMVTKAKECKSEINEHLYG